ncbi:MAG: flagellar biosynthesis protein FliQ [Eubacteriales bacterium]|nr:flagellar biosynthesis protein FliQ [Eubacteriales bacterium]
MNQNLVIAIMQDAITVLLKCSLPAMLAALGVGVLISIFQAATQINEQTLAFVPKIIATMLVLLLSFGFIMTQMSEFFARMMGYVTQLAY